MDFTTLTDEQLAEHLNEVLAEQERRRRLETMPQQLATMAAQYVADGGKREVIIEAVSTVPDA